MQVGDEREHQPLIVVRVDQPPALREITLLVLIQQRVAIGRAKRRIGLELNKRIQVARAVNIAVAVAHGPIEELIQHRVGGGADERDYRLIEIRQRREELLEQLKVRLRHVSR